MTTYDPFTGKPVDKASDLLPSYIDEWCDGCGAQLIIRCLCCGAPVCCPKCCYESRLEEA